MKIGVLGSGFGLYGYFPAICNLGFIPVLLESRRHNLEQRPELVRYLKTPLYSSSVEQLHASTDALVMAIVPSAQSSLLKQLIHIKGGGHFFLEKPLGVNSQDEKELSVILNSSNYSFSIAYLFLWTDWFHNLKEELSQAKVSVFEITWEVSLNLNSWKSDSESGGGLLNFYGTHLFAMYGELGFGVENTSVHVSANSIRVSGTRLNGSVIESVIRYAEKPFFQIQLVQPERILFFESQTPFGNQNTVGILDNRIPVLQKYILSNLLSKNRDFLKLEFCVRAFRMLGERGL